MPLQDVTVIFRRRGGDDLVQNLYQWATSVSSSPDVINMTFLPIISLLNGLPGAKHLARAIGLYLERKFELDSLDCFLITTPWNLILIAISLVKFACYILLTVCFFFFPEHEPILAIIYYLIIFWMYNAKNNGTMNFYQL